MGDERAKAITSSKPAIGSVGYRTGSCIFYGILAVIAILGIWRTFRKKSGGNTKAKTDFDDSNSYVNYGGGGNYS